MRPGCVYRQLSTWPHKGPQNPRQAVAPLTQVRLVTRCPNSLPALRHCHVASQGISAWAFTEEQGDLESRGSPISGRNVGSPDPLISTRNISSSPFCFSAVSPVSQGLGLLLGTWVGKALPQLALPPPGSEESHGTCLPAAGNHTLHWKTERKGGE